VGALGIAAEILFACLGLVRRGKKIVAESPTLDRLRARGTPKNLLNKNIYR
jgi:hypothetical protein